MAKPSHHRWEDIPREELINQIERRSLQALPLVPLR